MAVKDKNNKKVKREERKLIESTKKRKEDCGVISMQTGGGVCVCGAACAENKFAMSQKPFNST